MPHALKNNNTEKFRGQVLHSSDYKSADAFAGKNVLIVGLGESSADLTLSVAMKAADVCLISRNGPGAVIPRYHGGKPADVDTTRIYHGLPKTLFKPRSGQRPAWWRFLIWLESGFNTWEDDRLENDLNNVKMTRHHWMGKFGTKSANFVVVLS